MSFKKGDRVVRDVDYIYTDDDGFMQKGKRYTIQRAIPVGLLFEGSTQVYSASKFSIVPKNDIVNEIIKDL